MFNEFSTSGHKNSISNGASRVVPSGVEIGFDAPGSAVSEFANYTARELDFESRLQLVARIAPSETPPHLDPKSPRWIF